MNNKNELDQFYTAPLVAVEMVKILKKYFDFKDRTFYEPSAGTGNFIFALKENGISKSRISAIDIDPKNDPLIKKNDFLKINLRFSKSRIVIGNPPFGKRSQLAIKFINKGFEISNTVAMILPQQFERYLTQKNIDINAKLIYSKRLNKYSFIHNDSEYGVNCVFQIWTKEDNFDDLRLRQQKPRTHKDLETFIHNNTLATQKYFNKKYYKWDIAVHRQGYYDYSKIITKEEDLIKNRQYFFIKAKSPEAKRIIKKIDYEKLSKSNTQTPGFSTTDFIEEYKKEKRKYEIK